MCVLCVYAIHEEFARENSVARSRQFPFSYYVTYFFLRLSGIRWESGARANALRGSKEKL